MDTAAEERSAAKPMTAWNYYYYYYQLQVTPSSHDFRCSFCCFASPGRNQRTLKMLSKKTTSGMSVRAYGDWVFNGNSWSTKRFRCGREKVLFVTGAYEQRAMDLECSRAARGSGRVWLVVCREINFYNAHLLSARQRSRYKLMHGRNG